MLQLDSSLGSAGTLLEPCSKAAVAAGMEPAESHGLAVNRRDLGPPYWLSNETKSRKLEKRTYASIVYEGKRDCLIARR